MHVTTGTGMLQMLPTTKDSIWVPVGASKVPDQDFFNAIPPPPALTSLS